MGHPIPFLSLEPIHQQLQDELAAAFSQVYSNNKFILGDALEQFENAYAQFSKVAHCAGVGCGLDALSLSLKALSVGPGDEVIVPSNTFIATWIAVSTTGATIVALSGSTATIVAPVVLTAIQVAMKVFDGTITSSPWIAVSTTGATIVAVEPDKATYNIDVAKIEAAITKKTKAIIAVHLYGQPCEMEPLLEIASRFNLSVIEDNAQAHGAIYNGRCTGSFGIINATSFYPTKNLGALGDGGAITTNDQSLFKKVCTLRNYGSAEKNYNELIGVNSRLDDLQAAILLVKLKYLNTWNSQRQEIALAYAKGLSHISELTLPETARGATHVFHLYVVRTQRRDEFQSHLKKAQIATMIHYPVPPHRQTAYKHLNFQAGRFPIAEELANTSLSLPLWPGMTGETVDRVIAEVKTFFK